MLAVYPPKTLKKFQISVYFNIFVFTVARLILAYIDKKLADLAFYLDLAFGFLLLLLLTIGFFITQDYIFPFLCAAGLLWMVNNVVPFFEYYNAKSRDFESLCVYMIILRSKILFYFIIKKHAYYFILYIIGNKKNFYYL